MRVDLPAPLEPTRPVMPGRSSRVTWLTPMTGPYHLETRSKSSTGAVRRQCPRQCAGCRGEAGIRLRQRTISMARMRRFR